MSDTLTVLDFLNVSDRQKVQSILAESIIVDYGIVRNVINGKTVDVEHATRRVLMAGIQAPAVVQDARITYGVELLFPSSASFAQSWTVAVGDGVLLVGLQNVLPTTQGITESKQPPEFWHYSAQTLKAIPLQAVSAEASVQFGEANGKAFLRNQAQSLYTILNSFMGHVKTLTTSALVAPTSIIAPNGGGPCTGTVPALPLAASVISAMATDISNLAALLEE
jgi:hypothetical protein